MSPGSFYFLFVNPELRLLDSITSHTHPCYCMVLGILVCAGGDSFARGIHRAFMTAVVIVFKEQKRKFLEWFSQ